GAALALYEQARSHSEAAVRANGDVFMFQIFLSNHCYSIGHLQRELGKPAEALAAYDQVRLINERLAGAHPESPNYFRGVGLALSGMAHIEFDQKRFEEARAHIRRAIEWQRKALAAQPTNTEYRRIMGEHLTLLIRAAKELGHGDEAADAERELREFKAND